MSYKQAKSDFRYLFDRHNDPTDLCGDFCNTKAFIDILDNPTKANAEQQFMGLIKRYFTHGVDKYDAPLDLTDKRTKEIQSRINPPQTV